MPAWGALNLTSALIGTPEKGPGDLIMIQRLGTYLVRTWVQRDGPSAVPIDSKISGSDGLHETSR